jgi:hypothetical protein
MKKFRDTFEKAATQVEYANRNMTQAAKHLDHVDTRLDNIRSPGAVDDGGQVPELPTGEGS